MLITSEQNNTNYADTDNNKDNDSFEEGENYNRFAFVRSIPDDAPSTNRGISESEKRSLDATVTRSEHERVSTNWIECKVPWSKLYKKRGLNLQPNKNTTDTCDHL